MLYSGEGEPHWAWGWRTGCALAGLCGHSGHMPMLPDSTQETTRKRPRDSHSHAGGKAEGSASCQSLGKQQTDGCTGAVTSVWQT